MKDLLYIYKIMLRYYGYLIAGVIFMIGYALFSGASITMAVPLFDYVFPQFELEVLYSSWPEFYSAMRDITAANRDLFTFSNMLNIDNLRPLLAEYGTVMEHSDSMLMLRIVATLVFIIVVIKNIFFYMNKLMFANLNGKTIKDVRNTVFRNYMEQSLAFFSRYRIGDSLVRMVNDVEVVSKLFIHSLFQVVRELFLILVLMRIALFLNARLFLISLIVLPVTTLIVTTIGKKIKKYARRIQSKISDIFSKVEEVLTNIKIVKVYNREAEQISAVEKLNDRFFRFWRKAEIYKAFGVPISEINGTLIGIIILMIGGREVISGTADFTFGEFSAFLLALFSMLHPIKLVTKAYNDLKKAFVSLRRISAVINKKPDLLEAKDAVAKESFDEKIVFDKVGFSYQIAAAGLTAGKDELIPLEKQQSGKGSLALSDISFTFNKGEKLALVGSSGSGKTTVTNLLLRLYDTTHGEITIDGIPIKNIKIADLRKMFGVVTQESLLFTDTIAGNIRFGSKDEISPEQIKEACRIAYADEFIEQLPDKYDHYLYSKGSNLSGGQKQRLCIARAIVANPPVLILDEATSSLDTEAEQKVQKAIHQATEKRTVMIIAHRLSTVLTADKIIVLDKGRIAGIGTHSELLETCPRYKLLYELQFQA